ncbi:hypothetical protein KR100_12530 [Synechococcus sp. KORDI-100]|uniref:YggS family pyridoxal phosphate-dependent enzyme n=1 Tax=Synechococcus sp. KORDI-100 TaxID=1280380 RepID=UPI0004E08050|nr:YggS family pyridoxal phosphate-dependent enzyme [Synechococcus sp. KORDI-100]AII44176.1 hypothetical protein KR100_12530 [Synechococcus sp. KORDI-100]
MPSHSADRWRDLRAQLPDGARLLAVSKGHPAAAIREIATLGQRAFGESRLQEAQLKQAELNDLSLQWHFIGRLQSNKVRAVVRAFSVIHSLDSWSLTERTARIASEEGRSPEVFLQVKLRPDPNKGGWSSDALLEAWPQLCSLPALRIRGLMTMAPQGLTSQERRMLFEECSALADRLELPERSMGMSGDWHEAVASGSTWLRLGSALFGPRQPVKDG